VIAMATRMQEHYQSQVRPDLMKQFSYKNPFQVPRLEKIVVNVGLGVVTRAAPSLNIFAVGFAAMIPAGFLVLILSMTHIGGRIEWLWLQSFLRVRNLLGVPGG